MIITRLLVVSKAKVFFIAYNCYHFSRNAISYYVAAAKSLKKKLPLDNNVLREVSQLLVPRQREIQSSGE